MHAFLIDGLLKLPGTAAVVRKLTDAQDVNSYVVV